MFINTSERKVNISISDLVFFSLRKKEPFSKFDKAIKDESTFAIDVMKRETEKDGATFYPEVNLSCSFKVGDITVESEGKTSIISKNGLFTLNFIKSLRYPLKYIGDSFVSSWLCEAKCLAYILSKKRNLQEVKVMLSVFHTETLERRDFLQVIPSSELELFFKNTVSNFSKYLLVLFSHAEKRDESLNNLKFPFSSLRAGQKEISNEVYSAIKSNKNIVINAPTGIGKTVSTIYPALKALSRGECNRVFYLTAKNSGNKSALDALCAFIKNGADITVLNFLAKSKICDNSSCNQQTCSLPKGHDERMVTAIFELVKNHTVFTSELIKKTAVEHRVCPFMLQMELAVFADVVVCDYNYVFDANISEKLKGAFSGKDVLLVDEAHNLTERVRNISSAQIKLNKLQVFQSCSEINEAITSFLTFVQNDKEDADYSCEVLSSQSMDGLEREVNNLLSSFQSFCESHSFSSLSQALDAYTLLDSVKQFTDFITLRNDDYITFYNDEGNPEIFLVYTGKSIREKSETFGSLIMFSATLFPEEYYKYMLGCTKKDLYVSLPSPFNLTNFLVLAYSLSTAYSNRQESIEDVVRAIFTAGKSKIGNYIAFFPSYEYMNLALIAFQRLFPQEDVIYQKQGMNETEKQKFLNSFNDSPQKCLFAFAVLGGSFSEGVDLVGERLSGAIVVGIGSLPPSRKSSLISQYFSDRFFDGEKFAYHYPGLNKVFQAGGRVIRSENDRGFLLIIDDRFLTEDNLELLPDNWKNLKKVKNNNDIFNQLDFFWNNNI